MEKLIRRVVGDAIRVVVDLRDDCEVINADPGQIEQVLLNLAVNARDAMPDGGTLSIRVSGREIGPTTARRGLAPGRYVELAVRDDGCGMNEETRSRLFEPFYTTKGCGRGTGLGLATVATIASELDGDVSVESRRGQGTIFSVLIPRAHDAVVRLDQTIERTAVAPREETILIVEEEQVVRDLMRRILEHDGYKVLEVCDESAALELSRCYTGVIDGIVVDLALPHLQGLALVAEIAAGRPQLAAVYTSCYAEADLRDEGVLEQSVVCVEKPFGPHGLVRGVRRSLDARPLATSEGVISSGALAPRSPHEPSVTPIQPTRFTRPTRSATAVPGAIAADSETLGA
jgi:CheY-like chemotaxis protein